MARSSRVVLVAIVGTAIGLTGCGDDPIGDDTDGSGGADVTSAADGGADGTVSGGAVDGGGDDGGANDGGGPAETSIPLAPAAEAVSSIASGPVTVVQFVVGLDERDATIAFYDDWTGQQDDEYQRIESEGGGVSWQTGSAAAGEQQIIAVLAPLEGDDVVTVTLTSGTLD